MAIRALICDGDILARGALETILSSDRRFEILTTSTPDAAKVQASASRPHLALIGATTDDGNGLDLVRWFGTNLPRCRCIVIGPRLVDEDVVACHDAGAIALVTEGRTLAEILDAVHRAATGQFEESALISTARARLDHDSTRPFPDLNYIDRRILKLLARGYTNNQIAINLHYSTYTIRNRISRLLRIRGVENRTQLALLAQQQFGIGT